MIIVYFLTIRQNRILSAINDLKKLAIPVSRIEMQPDAVLNGIF